MSGTAQFNLFLEDSNYIEGFLSEVRYPDLDNSQQIFFEQESQNKKQFQSFSKPDSMHEEEVSVVEVKTRNSGQESSFLEKSEKTQQIKNIDQVKKSQIIDKKNGKYQSKSKKKDQHKNVPNHSTIFIIKSLLSKDYRSQVQILCQKHNVPFAKLHEYYKKKIYNSISLKQLRSILSYNQGSSDLQKSIKRVFYIFYIWCMQNVYPIHIFQSKIKHTEIYMKMKNMLIYLPKLKIKSEEEQMESLRQKAEKKEEPIKE